MKRLIFSITTLIIAAAFYPTAAQKQRAEFAGTPDFELPAEAKPFVEAGMKVVAYAESDLNGDGAAPDYLVVLELAAKETESEMNERRTLIIVRDRKGKLTLAARSERVVFPRGWGEASDPLEKITVELGGFSITNQSGGDRRWVGSWDFRYSPRDKNWQLARVVESDYNLPEKPWTVTYEPPESFGRLDFADFDPDDFLYKGERGERNRTSNSFTHLSREHAAAVKKYIAAHKPFRPAQISDCENKYGLGALRQTSGDGAHPYYAEADFNQDKINDFAVVLYNDGRKSTSRFKVLIFNGDKNGSYKVAYESEYLDLREGGIWTYGFDSYENKKTVTAGVFETDDAIWIEWKNGRYAAQEFVEPEE